MSIDAADAPPPAPQPHLQNALALRSGALVLGRFRVGAVLGSSSCAFTYSALDEQYNERVVIKEFFPRSLVSRTPDSPAVRAHSSADDQEFARGAKRFLREGELLADVSHPSLLRVRRAFEENGTAYVVADFHRVTSLREQVRSLGGRMLPASAVEICARILEALELIHAEGGLHRDISPDTVGLDEQGRPIIIGFPASRHLHGHGRDLTAGFAAIELYGAKGLGPWTDVYSSAALLYFLITGIVPPSAVERAAGETVTSPAVLTPGLAPAFANALLRGLSQLPEQRTHSAAEFQKQVLTSLYLLGQSGGIATDLPTHSVDRSSNPTPPTSISPLMLPADPGSRTLRLTTVGLVVPPDVGIGRKFMQWLSRVGRGSGEDAGETKSRLDPDEVAEIFAQLNTIGLGSPALPETALSAPVARALDVEPAPVLFPATPLPAIQPRIADDRLDAEIDDDDLLADRETPLVPVREDVSIVRGIREKPFVDETLDASSLDADAFDLDGFDTFTAAGATAADIASRDSSTFSFASRRLPRFRLPGSVTRRSRAVMGLAILIVLAGAAVGVPYAARYQSAKNRLATSRTAAPTTIASRQAEGGAIAPKFAAADSTHGARVENTSAGIVQQARQPAADNARRAETQVSSNRSRSDDRSSGPVPTLTGLPSVNVPLAAQTGTPQLLPPETLIDLRDRLAAGRQFSEGGDYASAGRVLRGALTQIDSLSNRFVESEALRSLRKDVEQEAQHTLDACVAENEIHRKRGGKILVCQ